MLSESLRRFLKSDLKKLTFIWGAFQAAAAIYWFLARFMGLEWTSEDRVDIGFVPVFYAFAVTLAVASFLYQRWAFSEERITARKKSGLRANSSTDSLLAQRTGYAELDESDKELVAVFGYVQTSYIVTWAIQEAIAILGLMLTIMTKDSSTMVIFSVAAFGLLFTTKPKAIGYLEWAARRG